MTKELTKPTLTKAQAMKLCEEIREDIGSIGEKLYQLHEGQGWTALGYLTWKQCIAMEFHHSEWWGKNQLRIAEVRKALPPPPKAPERGKGQGGAPPSSTPQSDRALSELAKVPEADRPAVLARAAEKSEGKPPTAKAIREAAKPDYGKCPNCAGTKWDTDDEGNVDCAKCHHPYGEPAGDVDEDRIKTQRSKTIKTVEALMRAFDDLQVMKARPEHDEAIKVCKSLLTIIKRW